MDSVRKSYVTDNKRTVLDFFKINRDHHYTIDNVINELDKRGVGIAKSSLYRIVGNLSRSGYIRRFEADGVDSFVYQYSDFGNECSKHFHLKCTKCGKLVHLECEMLDEIKDHVYKEHGFTIGGDCIINGICEKCSENTDENEKNV